jgi:putative flippase GtrA
MTDEAFVVPVAEAPPRRRKRTRVRLALRQRGNWLQLIRFGAVGASGYVVNLVVFTAAVHGAGFGYAVAATMAFVVALANNFFWNRAWTFRAGDGHAGFQAARFVVVAGGAFAFNLLLLFVLVEFAGVSEVPAQAIAIIAATPLNFLGNKLWSFRT